MSRFWRVTLSFCYYFLVLTSYYILKPVRESFFLGEKGYRNLPVVHLLVLAATFIAVIVYTKASRRLGPARLVTATNVFFLISILGFWIFLTQVDTSSGVLATARRQMAWVYYCWVAVFSVFAIALFWSLTHTVFTADEGSKCYGVIGSGATIGALTGGLLTHRLAEIIGTENLLVVAAAMLSPCIVFGNMLARLSRQRQTAQAELQSGVASAKKTPALTIFRNNRYLCVLGLIVMLTVVITVLDEYRYNKLINLEFQDRQDVRTAFFGRVYFLSNCIGLFFSLALTGVIQSIWGPRPGLLLFAGIVVMSGIAFLFFPSINTVLYSLVAMQAVGYSIYQWSRELLYTQTTAEEKFIAKGFIDAFMFRVGAGTAALALIGATAIGSGEDGLLTHAVTCLSWVTIPLGLLLGGMGWWISARFQALKAAAN